MLNRIILLLSILVFLGAWQVISMTDLPFIPSPQDVFTVIFFFNFWSDIAPDFFATLFRFFAAFIGAIILGVPLGLLTGYFYPLYKFLELPIDFFRAVPATALFPLFMLFFGIGDFSKTLLIIFSCSLIMMIHTISGVRHGVLLRRMAAKTMGANKLQIFSKVIFFDALPQIFTGIKIVLSTCIIIVVVLEMFVGSKAGLGKKIYDFHLTYRIPYMYSVIIIVGCLSYFLNRLFALLEKKVVHWQGKAG